MAKLKVEHSALAVIFWFTICFVGGILLSTPLELHAYSNNETNGITQIFRIWLTFGFVIITAAMLGQLFPVIGLPLITGYLIIGVIAGPYVLKLLDSVQLVPLSLVVQLALSFICFSAGCELYVPELKPIFKRIIWQAGLQAVFTIVLCTVVISLLCDTASLMPLYQEPDVPLPMSCRWALGGVGSSIMLARSPSSAIAIISELRAKGPYTSSVIGIFIINFFV